MDLLQGMNGVGMPDGMLVSLLTQVAVGLNYLHRCDVCTNISLCQFSPWVVKPVQLCMYMIL